MISIYALPMSCSTSYWSASDRNKSCYWIFQRQIFFTLLWYRKNNMWYESFEKSLANCDIDIIRKCISSKNINIWITTNYNFLWQHHQSLVACMYSIHNMIVMPWFILDEVWFNLTHIIIASPKARVACLRISIIIKTNPVFTNFQMNY